MLYRDLQKARPAKTTPCSLYRFLTSGVRVITCVVLAKRNSHIDVNARTASKYGIAQGDVRRSTGASTGPNVVKMPCVTQYEHYQQ